MLTSNTAVAPNSDVTSLGFFRILMAMRNKNGAVSVFFLSGFLFKEFISAVSAYSPH